MERGVCTQSGQKRGHPIYVAERCLSGGMQKVAFPHIGRTGQMVILVDVHTEEPRKLVIFWMRAEVLPVCSRYRT